MTKPKTQTQIFLRYRILINFSYRNLYTEHVIQKKGLCVKTAFGVSSLGKVLSLFGYVVKGLITLLIDLVSTLASTFYLREFFNKKQSIQSLVASTNTNSPATINESKTKYEYNPAEKARVKQMKMIIYLSVCTVFFHVIQLVCDILLVLMSTQVSILLSIKIITMLMVAVKQILNFFFFFYFNKKFRKTLKRCSIFATENQTTPTTNFRLNSLRQNQNYIIFIRF